MALNLTWSDNQEIHPISEELASLLERLLQEAGQAEKVEEGEVSLTFVTDQEIHELNKQYRNMDKPTDVLSFSMQEFVDEEPEILYELEEGEAEPDDFSDVLGDIVISVERAKAQAEDYGHSFEREVGFLFVHGFLHLIGYDHEDEAAEKTMMDKQEAILGKVGLSR
ncbi:metalloprotease [Paenibacillus swuensis]|uniref:Endoribonuclease YbeY n=1 Tax=Paenibacillus swuensis TaxID=1178515 RepID=A0A172TJU6_9BACL|nr:rRNA maturation RNase YbeY [Paenibacillus swuensis]ANE47321.1 metalloprotease [Paenibacillus swuensis]